MSEDVPTQWVDGPTVATWLGLTERHARRLLADGVLPKRKRKLWDLQGSVLGYIRHLQGLARRNGLGQGESDDTLDADPDAMPVEQRLKYWQAVRQRQASAEHLQEVADTLAEEHRRQAGEAVQTIRAAIEAANLPPETLEALRAAVTHITP